MELVRPSVVHIQVNGFSGPGAATGIVLDKLGRILTNQHVVDEAREISVTLSDDRVFAAQVVGEDPSVDIAVLRIDTLAGVGPPQFGDARSLRVGDDVIAIGHALALPGGPTVSKGVVSALDRSINAGRGLLTDLIQTDAAINSGNSGGPLVNMRGEVIGINTAEIPGERIGFAITINAALQVAQLLIVEGNRPIPDIGIEGINITPALAQIAKLPVRRGVGIVEIRKGGPADGAGLMVDDIIIQVDGRAIRDLTDLSRLLRQRNAGQTVNVTLVRGQDVYAGPVVLGAQPTPVPATPTGGK
ncbi:MAG: trypsin-like peptidase domain-containing protein [Chloroflexi bacterium]|nr:trypsin-like peptidase domain-containing protein [Chloroflexota bacterium]